MQKISSYLYPNRVQLLADLASFNVEYTNVYQRIVKIYNGIDNTIEFDIKNADQKRIDLTTVSNIQLNVMDASGNELPNSPYTVTPTSLKGIATVTIPQEDLADLSNQFLSYSVTCINDGADTILYADSRFGAVGTIELVGNAMPTFRNPKTYTDFYAEIDGEGLPLNHSTAFPAKFYEAVPTEQLSVDITVTGFKGSLWVEGTYDDTISVESFRTRGAKIDATQTSLTVAPGTSTTVSFTLDIGTYSYFRVTWQNSAKEDITQENPSGITGKVDSVTVS